MKIGMFGGTFNPPHLGHTHAAAAACKALSLDTLLLIPTASPPHKELPADAAPAQDRLEMLRLASRGLAHTEISEMELDRGGRSYTADSVEALQACHPGAELWLIVGGDMFLTIPHWYRGDWLLHSCGVAVLAREENRAELLAQKQELERAYGAHIRLLDEKPLEISSTELRAALKARGGRASLDPEVYAYILRHRLYGAKAEFDWLREVAVSMLLPKRVPHVLGCEQEAVKLARRWGADEDAAREAAILHDITKKLSYAEQLLLCEKYATMTDNAERESEKLLHAPTGAAFAFAELGVSEEVRDAIRWHTTGKPDMTLLEKIIYLADYIEPNREFDGLEELRRLAYTDLDRAMILGLRMSLEDMAGRGIVPHRNSSEALAFLERRYK